MRILVLGGTAWVGRLVAEEARDRGDEVICLARGRSGSTPTGVTFVQGDRSGVGAYRGLRGEFDRVVDVARQPGHVRTAAAALTGRVGRYVLVSSISAYADLRTGALHPPLEADEMASMEQYGAAKVAAETAAAQAFPAHTLARAGLIGGPGDHTGRTTYWPWRLAHPANGDVLVPGVLDEPVQVIDVRDLVTWLLTADGDGPFDLVGDAVLLRDHLAVAGPVDRLRPADPEWLLDHDVQPWWGDRSLPLWTGETRDGLMARSNAAAKDAGLTLRPLAETLQTVEEKPTGAGLTDAEERELLALL